jgi:hypothetical protein
MAVAGLAIGGLLVLAIIGVSAWAWRRLPPDVRIPVHRGLSGYNNYQSKTAGLVTWPAGAAIVYGIDVGLTAAVPERARVATVLIVLPVVLVILLVGEMGAIKAAVRR